MSCYEKVIQIEPDNLTSHWLSMNIFPVIYKNFDGYYEDDLIHLYLAEEI